MSSPEVKKSRVRSDAKRLFAELVEFEEHGLLGLHSFHAEPGYFHISERHFWMCCYECWARGLRDMHPI